MPLGILPTRRGTMDLACSALVLWAIVGAASDAWVFDPDCTDIVARPDGGYCWLMATYGKYPCCPFNDEQFPEYTAARSRQAKVPALLARIVAGDDSLNLQPLSFRPPADWHFHLHTASVFALSLDVRRISHIQQKDQTFRMHYMTIVHYRDCRLLHNCSHMEVDDRNELYDEIWLPRLDIAEREDTIGSMSEGQFSFWPDGWASSRQVQVGTFRCAFDFRDLPFDSHDCKLTFSVMGEDLGAADLEWIPDTNISQALQVSSIENAQWEIPKREDWRISRGVEVRNTYGGAGMPVRTLTAAFTLRRKPRYYILSFMLPATMFWLTSWVGLWVDAAAVPARAALGITPVLILNNRLNNLAAVLPAISEATRLEQYLLSLQIIVFAQLVEFAAVNYFTRQEKKLRAQKEAAASDDQPAGRWSSALEKKLKVARSTAVSLDFHMRWFSVLYVVVAAIAIFA